jgi:hypothetical protein
VQIARRIAGAAHDLQKLHGMGRSPGMASRSGSVRQAARLASSGARAARESVRLGAIGAALPPATAITLGHRLPILAGLSSASAAWQAAEIWRMTFEKPVAFWQGWLSLGQWPWHLWQIWAAALGTGRSQPELALRVYTSSLGAVRRGLTPGHRRVVGNARRLSRRGTAPRPP